MNSRDYRKVTQDDRDTIRAYNEKAELNDRKCEQCGQVMGAEWILNPVCGKCCRVNHRQACRKQ